MLLEESYIIAKKENNNYLNIIVKLTSNNSKKYESIIAKIKAYILEKKWNESKDLIQMLLSEIL